MNYTDSNPVAKKYLSNKRSFSLEYDTVENTMKALDTESFGEMMMAVADYEINGVMPDDNKIKEPLFAFIFNQFKRELDDKKQKYIKRCELNESKRQKKLEGRQ